MALPEGHALARGQTRAALPLKKLSDETFVVSRRYGGRALVRRYRTKAGVDGLPPGEGVFLPCSFWLADNYTLQNRDAEARALFERLLSLRNDVGLLAEDTIRKQSGRSETSRRRFRILLSSERL